MIEGLKSGDLIAISATARKLSEADLAAAIDWIEANDWKAFYSEDLFKGENQFAGSDEHRAKLMQSYIDNPEVKAIWNARGGYGSVRMVDRLDWSNWKKKNGILIGFSDVTVLHSDLYRKTGMNSLHATMPISLPSNSKECLDSLAGLLKGGSVDIELSPNKLNRIGESQGKLVGGNLSVLYSLLGSKSDINWDGKILFLEDLDEYLYHIDRLMQNLLRAGKLSGLAGLVVGGMTDMNDNAVPFGKSAEEIISETVAGYEFPVLFNLPSGHLDHNMPLWLGADYKLSVNQIAGKLTQLK